MRVLLCHWEWFKQAENYCSFYEDLQGCGMEVALSENGRRRPTREIIRRLILSSLCLLSFFKSHAVLAGEVDPSTLTGKVMCGYQGWFNCSNDGAQMGWKHWTVGVAEEFKSAELTFDLWPDMSEYGEGERFATGLKQADGTEGELFSSFKRATVVRHFEWMRDYEIDGVFFQRFANGLKAGRLRDNKDVVLENVREGAKLSDRVYAVMYDLSGLKKGEVMNVADDWLRLRREKNLTEDHNYLKHKGRPLVGIWGVGFNDGRKYSLADCHALITFFKDNGCSVLLGVPSWWRTGKRDAVDDPELLKVIQLADVVSPWTVGRYRTPEEARNHAKRVWRPDLEWCQKQKVDFLPVVFPGFSWSHLKGEGEQLNAIPRLKGQFLWPQFVAAKRVGCDMVYVGMFDEVDEGTAIFKCSNNPPTGTGFKFSDMEGLPSDFYLKLTGSGGRLLRGEIPVADKLPEWK